MKKITFILCCLFSAAVLQHIQAQTTEAPKPRPRYLREVKLSGNSYATGQQHSQQTERCEQARSDTPIVWQKSLVRCLYTLAGD